ncbi:glutamine synthetase [Enterovibrio norvegicus]|uniref:Glutamine synthetase family protein n=1 Tax=Enterovibrio norvegicus TaxID=188144 RepID=A0ABV4KZI6_9GAMM|nr:glutamine synthetase [Enterovibrio norvegicus]MCC4797177.1 glutamine synthetase [Enterovibrio norvegicus]OEF58238.1 glutamine synthetase [Enterovibrio norvegicus]PMH63965.1 glutamine synthetase [Enterovibrio norvegicus]PMI31694.1 glutamine synthetase [Enterovibrio norvegicus]PMI35313.1 glutamine synthetase [Enterovibrio norvegicus]
MEARDVKTAADAKKIIEERKLTHVKVGLFDNDGVMRGKYMSKDKFFSSLDSGFAFCDVVLGWDVKDQLYDNAKFTGWHTGYPDAGARVLPDTCREVLDEDGMLLFIAEFEGDAEAVCPRATLRRVLEKAAAMGFDAYAALEYEFFLFDETPHSAREKGFRNLRTITPDWFGYSMIRNSTYSGLYKAILAMGESMDFPIEGIHSETGPGVIEAALTYDNAKDAADKAALFKTYMKVLAQKNEMMATFMAKWTNDYPGQSGHIHVSLREKASGKSAFYDENAELNMSDIQRHFLAGQQKLMPEFLCMIAPTINSYSRMIPGFWAPTTATWGVENRTTSLRVIPGSEKSQRIEYRLGAADANPYLALAAALASGLYGIEHKMEPTERIVGNAYEQDHPSELQLPSTLWEAAQRFKSSDAAKSMLGDAFVEHFAASREWEEREFRKHVTDWELDRYFEII